MIDIPKPLDIEVILDAKQETVWKAWTTEEGIRSFFAPACRIELRVGGAYEILFNPEEPRGARGAEGTTILAIKPQEFLSFSWNNPPTFPEIRWQYAVVCIYFETVEEKKTRLRLVHQGWGSGESWHRARDYFNHAWNQVVIPRLAEMLRTGPVDWNNR